MPETINIPRDSTMRDILEAFKEQNRILLTSGNASPQILVPQLIREYGARKAFEIYVDIRITGDPSIALDDVIGEFYRNAKTGKVYGAEFYRFHVSNVSTGTKTDDNAEAEFAICTPGTNATPAVDPYADLALFMPININYKIGEDLEPEITEIEGVTDGFSLTNPNGLVGVMQMAAWVYVYNDGTVKGVKYSDTRINDGYMPLPEAVKASDNTFRPFVIHAKYVAGKDSSGLLTSASGLHPAVYSPGGRLNTSISHDGQIALWRQRGANYSGGCLCDRNFILLMFMIKYAHLDSTSVMSGCNTYSTAYKVALGEEDTNRVLLTPTSANFFLIGSTISVGTGTDRAAATGHDILDHYRITKKESVIVDEVEYTALYVDSPDVFTTTTDNNVLPEPWAAGATDNVRGHDGSPYSNVSNKEPAKIQGIEFMVGTYEVLADTAIKENGDGTASVHLCRRAASLAAGGPGNGSFMLSEQIPMPAAAGWAYMAEGGDTLEGLIVPTLTGASSSNAYRAGVYMAAATGTSWREWLASGYLGTGAYAGLPCVHGDGALSNAAWHFAARASGSGGNRGEYGA